MEKSTFQRKFCGTPKECSWSTTVPRKAGCAKLHGLSILLILFFFLFFFHFPSFPRCTISHAFIMSSTSLLLKHYLFLSHFYSMNMYSIYCFFLSAFFSFPILQLHYYIIPQRATCFSGSYRRSLNFKLITTLLARRACLVIFTLFRGPFYLPCFFPPIPVPFLLRTVSVVPSLHYYVTLILSNCRDFITTHCIFISLSSPSLSLELRTFKYFCISSYSAVLPYLYVASH